MSCHASNLTLKFDKIFVGGLFLATPKQNQAIFRCVTADVTHY